jgi:CRP/FNR family transcriptional regulator, anaerobic regulatory protein
MLTTNFVTSNVVAFGLPGRQIQGDGVTASAPGPRGCASCHLRGICLTSEFVSPSHAAFGELVLAHRRVKAGQAIYRTGDSFSSVYVLKAGFVKTLALFEDGREQVSGFYMPGDTFGVDGMAFGQHANDAIALDDADVCAIPYDKLEQLSLANPAAQRSLYRMFSQEIVRRQDAMVVMGTMSATQRTATFLLDLSRRFSARGLSASEFLLRMTRDEIGSLLGLKLETVSRVFSKLQSDGLMEIDGKHVRIVSIPGLRSLITH